MVLSVVTYAMVFGWPYDVGFVALFFVMSWVTTLPHGSVISMWACKPKPGSASPARF